MSKCGHMDAEGNECSCYGKGVIPRRRKLNFQAECSTPEGQVRASGFGLRTVSFEGDNEDT